MEDVTTEIEAQARALQSGQRILHGEIMDEFNPAGIGWPATLALEVAMQSSSTQEICESYGITRSRWNEIRVNPAFMSEVNAAILALRKEGAAFKIRAQMQALELLKKSWSMIHDPAVAASIQADLIKFTIKVAGLDASKEQGVGHAGTGGGNNLVAVNIHLG